MRKWQQRAATLCIWFAIFVSSALGQRLTDLSTRVPVARGDTVVIGFLGGVERWNDADRGVRRLALNLRALDLPGVHSETFGNHSRATAIKFLRQAIDTNGDGKIDAGEAASARVILYGQSLGGSAVVKTARDLDKLRVPVLLTVQVDSFGPADGVIPANVAAAANFYQRDPFTIWGQGKIRAADPSRTQILGNFRFSYAFLPASPSRSWVRRKLGGSHAKMADDPATWALVETLILNAISKP
jgi:hypothetical protein